jgi:hypothetical protein
MLVALLCVTFMVSKAACAIMSDQACYAAGSVLNLLCLTSGPGASDAYYHYWLTSSYARRSVHIVWQRWCA